MDENQYLEKYAERKEKIILLLENTANFLRDNDKAQEAESFFKLKTDVEKNLFSVVLIGEFSVGKSTFLNALMGRRMLPSFKKETTATVNFLRHTSQAPNKEVGIVYYRDGSTKNLPDLNVETIAKFVSTKGDTAETTIAKTVEKVDLFLESKFLDKGVMLVDSPGLNGVTENLEDITRRQIRESHACIFMFSTDHPGTRTEFEILRDLRQEYNRIFIVLNKIETVKESEGETVDSIIDHLKKNYKKQFPDATLPEIYPISAEFALAARDKSLELERHKGFVKDDTYYSELERKSQIEDFENRLFRYLTEGERTREQLSEPIHKILNTLKNEREELDAQINVLEESKSTEELEQQKSALEKGLDELQQERSTKTKPIRERFNVSLRDFKDKISARCEDIGKGINLEVKEIDDIEELQKFADDLPHNLKKRFGNLAQSLEDNLRDDLISVVDESTEYIDGLQETLTNVGGIELKISVGDFKLSEIEVGKHMEEMERKFAEKRMELKNLEDKIRETQKNKIQARRLEIQQENLQHQLREISERRNNLIETFTIPAVEYRTRTVTKKRPRTGLFGRLANVLVGDKEYIENEETVDSSAHDDAIKMRNEGLSAIDSERENVLVEMKKYSNQNLGSSESLDFEIQDRQRQLTCLNESYKEEIKKYMAGMEKDVARAKKKIYREISNYVENFFDENKRTINSYLEKIKSKMFNAVQEMLLARVNAEIQRQQKKIDKLIEDSKTSAAMRDEKLQKARTDRDRVIELLAIGAELENELEYGMADAIEEE